MLRTGRACRCVLPCPGADQWPRFRGPSGQGDTNQKALPTVWDKTGRNILWRTKVPGAGNSSPIIWGEHIFLTSSSAKGTERFVHCFNRADGRLRWTRQVPVHAPEPAVRDKNGYASATPVTDGKRVISFLGSCGLVCHDFDGNLLWHYDAFTVKTGHGAGASPLLYKDLVILAQDQNQSDSIFLALDKTTGKKVWQAKRARAMTWTTPIVVRVGERDEMIIAGGETVRGYDPASGKELWSLRALTQEGDPGGGRRQKTALLRVRPQRANARFAPRRFGGCHAISSRLAHRAQRPPRAVPGARQWPAVYCKRHGRGDLPWMRPPAR